MPHLEPFITVILVIAGAVWSGYLTYRIAIKEARENIERAFFDESRRLHKDHVSYVKKVVSKIEDTP